MTMLRNSPERWGWFAQLLHWSIALLIIGLAAVGLVMGDLPNSPDKLKVFALHKSVGLTVLALNAESSVTDNEATASGATGGGIRMFGGRLTIETGATLANNEPDDCFGTGCPT